MSEYNIKLERLYQLQEELEKLNRTDDAATIRWAIFELERIVAPQENGADNSNP